MTDAARIAILEEEVRQLRLRVQALSEGPTTDERLAMQLHVAFRKAAEVPQVSAWPPQAQEAWKLLYEAVRDNNFGLGLIAKQAESRE